MAVETNAKTISDTLDRRLEATFPDREQVVRLLAQGKPLRVYLGIDPTGPLHVGHLVPLKFLNDLHKLGHQPVIVIGDFTATIGDPSGKDTARVALSEEEVREHMQGYLEQIKKILPEFDVEYNSKWLKPLTLGDVLRLASHVTVQQMIARDMFQTRLTDEKPIYLHEFLYPLMQGYDSVAMEIDGEVGGNDQTFNMLVGRDLEREYVKKEKIVFATKLLVDPASGKKMSKTEGNFIALTDTPQEIRRKILNFPDELIPTVFRLCTDVSLETVPADPRQAKEQLANDLVAVLHGTEAIEDARRPVIKVSHGESLAVFLKVSGATSSVASAKDLIDQGAVKINGEVSTRWDQEIRAGDEIQVGKGKFFKVT